MKLFYYLFLFLFINLYHLAFSQDINGIITVDNNQRSYILHLPKKYSSEKYPLVMVFHGGRGTAEQIRDHTKFNKLADKENFIVLYPQGLDNSWNDGRIGDKLPVNIDDVKFINQLLDELVSKYNIDTNRIFSSGISNGGFFSIYLAFKLNNRILAVAPVCASIPENIKDSFKLDSPVSLMIINGTKDPLVKYDGGAIGFFDDDSNRGSCISTDWTIKIWTENNQCQLASKIEQMDDNADDGCKAEKTTYYKCKDGSKVVLIKVIGGGHTWPGASQYLPKIIIGNLCKDFNATQEIWDFFKSIPNKN
jgi:polyhydroxybutyrate depolymerase